MVERLHVTHRPSSHDLLAWVAPHKRPCFSFFYIARARAPPATEFLSGRLARALVRSSSSGSNARASTTDARLLKHSVRPWRSHNFRRFLLTVRHRRLSPPLSSVSSLPPSAHLVRQTIRPSPVRSSSSSLSPPCRSPPPLRRRLPSSSAPLVDLSSGHHPARTPLSSPSSVVRLYYASAGTPVVRLYRFPVGTPAAAAPSCPRVYVSVIVVRPSRDPHWTVVVGVSWSGSFSLPRTFVPVTLSRHHASLS